MCVLSVKYVMENFVQRDRALADGKAQERKTENCERELIEPELRAHRYGIYM